jgi:hypothetical protein
MGWEKRSGKLYYYRKERVAGRVRSVYLGSGERAIAASLEDGVPVPQSLSVAVAQPEPDEEQFDWTPYMLPKEPEQIDWSLYMLSTEEAERSYPYGSGKRPPPPPPLRRRYRS